MGTERCRSTIQVDGTPILVRVGAHGEECWRRRQHTEGLGSGHMAWLVASLAFVSGVSWEEQ